MRNFVRFMFLVGLCVGYVFQNPYALAFYGLVLIIAGIADVNRSVQRLSPQRPVSSANTGEA